MNSEDVARAVLAKIAGYDQTLTKPDPGTVAAWAEVFEGVRIGDALQAVTDHYASQTRRAMPADIRKGAVAVANDRQLRELPAVHPQAPAGQVKMLAWCRRVFAADRAKAGRPIRPESDSAALRVPCPWQACRAAVSSPCVTNGHRRGPHPGRVDAAKAGVS